MPDFPKRKKSESEVTQSCPTLCNPMDDCSLPGFSVHGIFQARVLERVAISSSRGPSQPRNRTQASYVSCIGRQILSHCATLEALTDLLIPVRLRLRTCVLPRGPSPQHLLRCLPPPPRQFLHLQLQNLKPKWTHEECKLCCASVCFSLRSSITPCQTVCQAFENRMPPSTPRQHEIWV